ncbi:hypothetical protein [Gaoshiqia sediminis]|uniref:Uncharacterized protein n=1 Tax=Gaoshiqia sediminis TaxID=2986998 RepID=A0AA42C8R8_9BACT|nr:hypothetical protein [Gaoshiqia sediminis]MCW0485029.1 hypothetical protein [Gaoshiqia sediminis]
MNILLKMKAWQLFFISFILPWILSFLYLFFVDLETFDAVDKLMGAISIMYYSVFLAWNYKVVKTFNKNSDALTKKQIKRLDWLIAVLVIYILYLTTHISKIFPDSVIVSILIWILILAASFAFFYILFSTAKTLKYMQLKNQLRTSDIIVEMFVIFYFPIGVWWVQKKVNRYYNEYKNNNGENIFESNSKKQLAE